MLRTVVGGGLNCEWAEKLGIVVGGVAVVAQVYGEVAVVGVDGGAVDGGAGAEVGWVFLGDVVVGLGVAATFLFLSTVMNKF